MGEGTRINQSVGKEKIFGKIYLFVASHATFFLDGMFIMCSQGWTWMNGTPAHP